MDQMGASAQPFFFLINFRMDEIYVLTEKELTQFPISFQMPGKQYSKGLEELRPFKSFLPIKISFQEYLEAFNKVQKELKDGNTYLLNLTFQTGVQTDASLESIYHYSEAPYKLLFKDRFVVYSPESFVKISNGIISSYPMKGTIGADIVDAEKIILADEKESAEHRTIVDLIRNDLGIAGQKVRVEKYRYIDRITTNHGDLLQISSKITAQLPEDYCSRLGQLLFGMLPAGSVTGAPKKKTVEIILETENYERGFYTGIFGYFDGNDLDSAVMIRFFERLSDGTFVYKSGGGITAKSDAEKEYQELIDKVYVPFTREHTT